MSNTKASPSLICVYPGRFSPPHRGHLLVYRQLTEQFGKEAVYILTADPKIIDSKNPFSFKEKKELLIAAGFFPKNIVQLKGSAYNADHIAASIGSIDMARTILIASLGEKDAHRLLNRNSDRAKGFYLDEYGSALANESIPLRSMDTNGYIHITPNITTTGGEPLSASSIREALKKNCLASVKSELPPAVYACLQEKYSG
ncbi:MAG: hypothetical protein GY754_09715 [bacterium]|nr:hypothetical protein [bacterium]